MLKIGPLFRYLTRCPWHWTSDTVTIVMYHSVHPIDAPYTIKPDAFYRHIQVLKKNYQIVALKHVARTLQSNSEERKVAITFDDAFGDFLEYAFPILSKLKVPCSMFVPTGFIGKHNTWDLWNQEIPQKRIMDREELVGLKGTGLVDFGSHGVDHLSMRQLPLVEMRRQAIVSKEVLEDALDVPVTMFAYPYGQRDDFSSLTGKVIDEAGYELAVTTCWGTWNSEGNLFRLKRIYFDQDDDDQLLHAKIQGSYDWRGMKESLGFMWRSGMALGKTLLMRGG
jgi:peptidoglycan/xylan/chitin deacetylase (PgdA/CDA1 family)